MWRNFLSFMRREWSKWFNTINCTIDLKKQILKEPLIDSRPFTSEKAIEQILVDYSKYISRIQNEEHSWYIPNEKLLKSFCQLWNDSSLFDRLLKFTKNNPIPTIETHGDLWKSNMLYDGVNFYYIDFEYAAQRIFFYDIIMFILAESLRMKNDTLLDMFLSKQFDDCLVALSKKLNYNYDVLHKDLYLILIVYEWYSTRWVGTKNENLIANISQIVSSKCLFLNK